MSLSMFLSSHKVRKDEPKTHTSMFPGGSYYIKSEEDVEKFWINYCNSVLSKEKLGITEIPPKISPLRIDFDFKFELSEGLKRKYTQDDIEVIVSTYQNIITDIVEDYKEKYLNCIVLEKEPRTEDGFVKDGFHIHFPYFRTNSFVQDVYIRNKIMGYIENGKEFENFRENVVSKIVDTTSNTLTLKQQLEKMVDKVATKTWLMYGSSKKENLESFKISMCYDHNGEQDTFENIFSTELKRFKNYERVSKYYYLPRLLSIRHPIIIEDDESKSMSSVASSRTNDEEQGVSLNTKVEEEYSKFEKLKFQKKRICTVQKERPEEESVKDLMTLKDGKILEMLKDFRADDHDNWMNVGWILFNISQGSEMGLEMWKDFSSRSDKYDNSHRNQTNGQQKPPRKERIEQIWDSMELRGKTIASLFSMAKEDNPDAYNDWKKDQLDTLLDAAVSTPKPTHFAIANVIHKLYEDKFVCASITPEVWFSYYNHRYHRDDGGIAILKLIPTEITQVFLNFVNRLQKRISNDDPDKERLEKKRDRAFKIIQELGQTNFGASVLKMCRIHFYKKDFLSKLDNNRFLIGFENGVYDLRQGIFRAGTMDDWLTQSTKKNYNEYSWDHEDVTEVMEYLTKVFVNPKLRYYFLDYIATCLMGSRMKLLVFFIGEGDGGKSMIIKLLKEVFGEYSVNLPRETFIVGKSGNAGSARPDLSRISHKLISFTNELTKSHRLDISFLKEISGGDEFYARKLFENGGEIKSEASIIFVSNEKPDIPRSDEATWNRVRVIDFESRFPKDNDPNYKIPETFDEQMKAKIFPRDSHLGDKLPGFAAPLMWILLQRFKNYYKNGTIEEPNEVKVSSEQYKISNNLFLQFVDKYVEKVENKKEFIRVNDAFKKFKEFVLDYYPSYVKEYNGKSLFENELQKKLGKIANGKWMSYQFKILDSDMSVEIENSSSESFIHKKLINNDSEDFEPFDID